MSNRSELFQAIENTSLDAIITIDRGGLILSFNAAAEKLFGYDERELLGRNVKLLMPNHFRQEHDRYIGNYLATGERKIIGIGRIVAGERKDGSTFPLELSVGEAMVGDERVFVGFLRDLTTTEQDHRRLQELQTDLFHVSRLSEMGQVASGLAHEVNQPLGAIMNYAQAGRQMASAGQDAAALSSILEKIDQQASRAAAIIKRLRAFIEKRDVEKREEQLHSLIEESLGLALVGLSGAGVRLSVNLRAERPMVLVDKVQIQQVMVNLVRNALDATEGQPGRKVEISSAASANNFIEVVVSDNGPGISPDVAGKLFNAFVTTKEQGMGVGLSISQAIVEAHGGRLWFSNNPEGGASFHFTLPMSHARPTPDRDQT